MRTMLASCLLAIALSPVALAAAGKMENWTDAEGKTFKGAPVGIVGPHAMFRTSRRGTMGVRLRNMSAADCVRYHEATRDLPERAEEWALAASALSKQVFAQAHVLRDQEIVRAELGGRPEPEIYLLIFGWHDHGESWDVLGVIRAAYERMCAGHPDVVEALFLGVRHDAAKNRRMITESNMPWLVTHFEDQRKLSLAMDFQPRDPPSIVVVTRHGALLHFSSTPTKAAIENTLGELEMLLVLMRPGNFRTARDRKNYLTAIQPVVHRTGRCDPVLLASPLDRDALHQSGVARVDATIVVGADHAVKDVTVSDNGGVLPEEFVTALADGLAQAVFVAGVENGRFVESTYEYHLATTR